MSAHRDLYAEFTDRIVTMLEEVNPADYINPWVRDPSLTGGPVSVDGRAYRGLNAFWLPILCGQYASQTFGTYKAWQRHGAQVRRGEKGTMVALWKPFTRPDPDNEDRTVRGLFLRSYTVFAAEQVDGFDLDTHLARRHDSLPRGAERVAVAESVLDDYMDRSGVQVRYGGGDRAFYAPSVDSITMPPREAFRSTDGFYSVLFHEAGHSTGHSSRLNRDFSGRFGTEAYAFEELVAEMTAAFVCGALGVVVDPRPDHARYLASWLKTLRDDKRAIFTAASKAQAAADLILGANSDEESNDDDS